jgi:hypothetical protein
MDHGTTSAGAGSHKAYLQLSANIWWCRIPCGFFNSFPFSVTPNYPNVNLKWEPNTFIYKWKILDFTQPLPNCMLKCKPSVRCWEQGKKICTFAEYLITYDTFHSIVKYSH